jgi:SAM-dependent methyltransferase
VLDYDKEAASYDATRGGEPRAAAAAEAITALLPPDADRVVDLACGTGIVTARLPGRALGVDRSPGMAKAAAARLPGRVLIGDVTKLPLAANQADAAIFIWLLHLLSPDGSAAAIAEAARILRPGGTLITTVNKRDAAFHDGDDASVLARRFRPPAETEAADDEERVMKLAAQHGLAPAGTVSFPGIGQGMSPRDWREHARDRWPDVGPDLDAALAALPDQDRPRPGPVYTVLALSAQR